MPRPTRTLALTAGALLVVGEWAYRVADSILGIPADAEAKHFIWRD